MITEFSQIERLFHEMSGFVKKATIYMIGGGALMYHGHKSLTKDVDLVVDTRNEFDDVVEALMKLGFIPQIPDDKAYSRFAISQMFIRENERIDLFCRYVCSKFSLSKGMKERAVKAIEFGDLKIYACSPDDILLFKTMTERGGDMDDCLNVIARYNVKWDVVLGEAQHQALEGQEVWITWMTVRLEDIEERGIPIPIMDDMRKLSDDYMRKWEAGLLERNPEFK